MFSKKDTWNQWRSGMKHNKSQTHETLGFDRQNQHSSATKNFLDPIWSWKRSILTSYFPRGTTIFPPTSWLSLRLCSDRAILDHMLIACTGSTDIARRRLSTSRISCSMPFRTVSYKMPFLNRYLAMWHTLYYLDNSPYYRFYKHIPQEAYSSRDIHW